MVNKQPEALRLANILQTNTMHSQAVDLEAAAELRRLQAENDDFRATCDHLTRENAEQIGEIVALKEQRDELLEFAEEVRHTGDTRLSSMAIAVIAKATTGETK